MLMSHVKELEQSFNPKSKRTLLLILSQMRILTIF
jgi:hypothetical protein